MKIDFKWIFILLAIVIGVVVFAFSSLFGTDRTVESDTTQRSYVAKRQIADKPGARKGRSEMRIRAGGKKGLRRAVSRSQEGKPRLPVEDRDLDGLDELQKQVVRELQKSLDSEDFKRISACIARMREMGMAAARRQGEANPRLAWSRHVPSSMRQSAVAALGWFGAEALSELADFVADSDPEIARMATEAFELAMDDLTLGDRDRAEIIKQVSGVITDEDMADWLCMEINNMRHSVGIDTLLYLNENASDVVKEKIPETIEFFTGEDDIKTAEDAQKWLEENPDDPEDDDIYGPTDTGEADET